MTVMISGATDINCKERETKLVLRFYTFLGKRGRSWKYDKWCSSSFGMILLSSYCRVESYDAEKTKHGYSIAVVDLR